MVQVDLPALLGVDLVHCERAAAVAVAEHPGVLSIQGELITTAHLDSLASEADQLLQVCAFAEVLSLTDPL